MSNKTDLEQLEEIYEALVGDSGIERYTHQELLYYIDSLKDLENDDEDYCPDRHGITGDKIVVSCNTSDNKYKSLRCASSSTATSKKEAEEVQAKLKEIRAAKAVKSSK